MPVTGTVSVFDGVSVYSVDLKLQNSVLQPAQDYVLMGGLKSPGLAIVKNIVAPRGWDKREGYGFSGASVVFHGAKLATFDVEFQLWLDEHWLAWKIFSQLLGEPRGFVSTVDKTGMLSVGSTTGLGIHHPVLSTSPLSISSVVVTNVTGFEQDDEGLWSCTVSFLEFRPPQQALAKPDQAIPAFSKPQMVAKTAFEIEAEQKTAEFYALARGK